MHKNKLNKSISPELDVNKQDKFKVDNSKQPLKRNHSTINKNVQEKIINATTNDKEIDTNKSSTSTLAKEVNEINFSEVVPIETDYNKGLMLNFFQKGRKDSNPNGDSNESGEEDLDDEVEGAVAEIKIKKQKCKVNI